MEAVLEFALADLAQSVLLEDLWEFVTSPFAGGLTVGVMGDTVMEPDTGSDRRTRERFDSRAAAAKYASRLMVARRAREARCILSALTGVPRGANVLDLPCGTGFLAPLLVERGYRVTCADSSPHMIERAERTWLQATAANTSLSGRASFEIEDIFDTSFGDGEFDAVICNRLFHHFTEPQTRRAALAELRRISRGPVIVFFFHSFALDSIRLRVLRTVFGKWKRDRMPISRGQFAADGLAAGLALERVVSTRWGISPQCYGVLKPHTWGGSNDSETVG